MNIEIGCAVEALFALKVYNAAHELVRQTPQFKNLVLDSGLYQMGVGEWINRCCVGTGSSTPVASQVQLDSFVASSTTKQAVSSGANVDELYGFYRVTYRFGLGAINANVSEVGLGWADESLWNRALIRDMNGQPTTITVMQNEYLDVVCEIRRYQAKKTGSFDLKNKQGNTLSTHQVQIVPDYFWAGRNDRPFTNEKAAMKSAYTSSAAMPAVLTADLPSPKDQMSIVNHEFSGGNQLKCSATVDLAKGNWAAGNHSLQLQDSILGLGYKLQFDPPIIKDNTQKLVFDLTLSWGRREV